jgi:hypothetical protein
MNNLKVSRVQYAALLALFPASWQDKLTLYTGEELYYAYRLCLFVPYRDRITGDIKGGDVTFASLRAKLVRYLKGISHDEYGRMPQPIWPDAWIKLGRRWAKDFNEEYIFTQPVVEQNELTKLKDNMNAKRIA